MLSDNTLMYVVRSMEKKGMDMVMDKCHIFDPQFFTRLKQVRIFIFSLDKHRFTESSSLRLHLRTQNFRL